MGRSGVGLQLFGSVDLVPPCWVVLEPAVEPCYHRVDPFLAFVEVHDAVVFALDHNECRGNAEEFEGSVHLDRFADRHIGIGGAVGEEDGLMDLVGVEEWRTIDIEVFAGPRVGVGGTDLAIAVTPIAFAPVGGVVGDAGMADAGSEEVGLGEQQLGHESAIGGADAANLVFVDPGILCKPFSGLDDILGDALAHGVDMACAPFLAESGGSTGVDYEHYISVGVPVVGRVVAATTKATSCRTAAAIIMYDDWIFDRSVEVCWQIVVARDGVTILAHK